MRSRRRRRTRELARRARRSRNQLANGSRACQRRSGATLTSTANRTHLASTPPADALASPADRRAIAAASLRCRPTIARHRPRSTLLGPPSSARLRAESADGFARSVQARARLAVSGRVGPGLNAERRLELLEQAAALDPEFALAHATMASLLAQGAESRGRIGVAARRETRSSCCAERGARLASMRTRAWPTWRSATSTRSPGGGPCTTNYARAYELNPNQPQLLFGTRGSACSTEPRPKGRGSGARRGVATDGVDSSRQFERRA